jgi:hypothetical protein
MNLAHTMLEKKTGGGMCDGRKYAGKQGEKCLMYLTFPWSLLLPAGFLS